MAPRMSAKASTFFVVPAILAVLLTGCSPKETESVVAKVGNTPITLSDYENLYIKSSGSRETAEKSSLDERTKFLGLMTNFRLKLADAYGSGLDRQPDIQREIHQYKGSLAASYLTDREVNTPGLKKLFERRSEELRASHILLNLSPEASIDDSVNTYAKAYDIIKRLKAGAKFEELADEFSQDPSVKQNHGDLYYFTGGQMVPVFEDAAYALKIGEISPRPVRTPYGLHIIKVVDRKPAPGEVQCSHIMIRFERQDPTPEDTMAALQKIIAIQDSLQSGVDFAELAQRNSGDPGSAARGGDLGWFTRRRWIQSFDEVAITMKPGQISNIVRTIYGYHLIKCTDARPPKSFEDSKKDLQQIYQQVRFQDDYTRYLNGLKRETGYMRNDSVMTAMFATLDSTSSTRDSAWAAKIPAEIRSLTLYRFGPRTVSVDSTVALINSRPDMSGTPLRATSLRPLFDKIGEQLIYEVKAETIERDYPEFAAIMKEYSEGILLYQIEQDRVWNRVAVTDSALRSYFDTHHDQFTFPNRVKLSVLHAANDSIAGVFYDRIAAGATLEDIVRADSIRMKTPVSYPLTFKAAALPTGAATTLQPLKKLLADDHTLRLTITAYTDTLVAKTKNAKMAEQRISATKTWLVKKMGIDATRISTQTRVPATSLAAAEKKQMLNRVTIDVVGRRAGVIGTLENLELAADDDERTMMADSLNVGQTSRPYTYEGGVHLIRLDGKEAAREKTFDEAGTEVSSAFQEYESKRIEQEWLQRLRAANPVVEYPEVLKHAFAPAP